MLIDLVRRNRSFRRFEEKERISPETLKELVELARLSASAANMQPLKFLLSCEPEKNEKIFPCLGWAGYLKGWEGPAKGERPAAYIVILGDREIAGSFDLDPGIAAQSILLGAAEKGLGGCMIGSIARERLRDALEIPECYEIILVLAIGRPAEAVVLDEVAPDGDIKYWRDNEGIHHVPKRPLDEIVVE